MALSFSGRTDRLKRQLVRALSQQARQLVAPAKAGILKFRNPISTIGPCYLAVQVYAVARFPVEVLRTGYDLPQQWVQLEDQPLDYLVRLYEELAARHPALEIVRTTTP